MIRRRDPAVAPNSTILLSFRVAIPSDVGELDGATETANDCYYQQKKKEESELQWAEKVSWTKILPNEMDELEAV